jgi:hypothetical protein
MRALAHLFCRCKMVGAKAHGRVSRRLCSSARAPQILSDAMGNLHINRPSEVVDGSATCA